MTNKPQVCEAEMSFNDKINANDFKLTEKFLVSTIDIVSMVSTDYRPISRG